VRTVNLAELAPALVGKADEKSKYKRLQRFFRHFELNYLDFAYLRSCTILNKWVSAALRAAETRIYRSRAPRTNDKCERCKI
jgi:hypothetical protein